MLNPHIPTQNLKKQKKTHDNPWRLAPQLEFPSHKFRPPQKKKHKQVSKHKQHHNQKGIMTEVKK